jgi:hypothetical protein
MTAIEFGSAAVAPPRDPRAAVVLPERDYAALRYIGAWYEVAQYQLEDAIFPERSPTIASRCVRRLLEARFIVVERWNRVGLNLIRLTSRGRMALLERGCEDDSIFVPERAVALKDLAHHLWIVDAGLMLRALPVEMNVAPCWMLRRRLAATRPPAIPDLLALRSDASGTTDAVIAVEIDLGGERLKNVFVPKLGVLRDLVGSWAGQQAAAIIVLTVGPRRIAALNVAIEAQPHTVPIAVFALPSQTGRPGLAALRTMLRSVIA